MKQMDKTKKRINGTTFYIAPFPAFTAARVSGEHSSLLAPILGSLSPLLGGEDADSKQFMDSDLEKMLPIIASALGQLDGDKFEHLAKMLLVNYKNIVFADEEGDTEILTEDDVNEIFCADLMGMITLGFEVVKINFGGFFRNLPSQFGNLHEITENAGTRVLGMKNGEAST